MSGSSTLRQQPPALRSRGLLQQLFLFIVLPMTALLVAVAVGSLTLHARAMRQLVGERDGRAARAAADSIAEQLNHRAAAIRGLGLRAAASSSADSVLADYGFLLPDFEGGLALFDSDGALRAATNAPETWQGRPIADLLAHAANKNQPQFSPAFEDPAGGEYVQLVAATTPGGPAAVGRFFPASLAHRALAGVVSSNGQISAWVVDDRRQLLYQAGAPRPPSELAQHPGVTSALRGESGSTYVTVAGAEHVIAYVPVETAGFALVIEEPWEAVDNPMLRLTQSAPLLLIPLLLLALVALWFGIRQIVQPLQALEGKAAELGWGRFEAIEAPAGGIAEIRHLQAELIRMAHVVHVRLGLLAEFRLLLDSRAEEIAC